MKRTQVAVPTENIKQAEGSECSQYKSITAEAAVITLH
jgi:hypothetical protein